MNTNTIRYLLIDCEKWPITGISEVPIPNETFDVTDFKEKIIEKSPILLRASSLVVWRCEELALSKQNEAEWLRRIEEVFPIAKLNGSIRGGRYQHWLSRGARSCSYRIPVTTTTESTVLGEDEGMEVDENTGRMTNDKKRTEYKCLHNIQALAKELLIPVALEPTLVIREEYEWIHTALEEKVAGAPAAFPPCFVLTGQPGIGKTGFLIYLLLYRLERRLPTAIQITPESYRVFDSNGIAELRGNEISDSLSDSDCWALCDSNSNVKTSCLAFLASSAVIIQATAGREDQWKEWCKQKQAQIVVMDLPCGSEIAAIARANGLDPTITLSVAETWGPSTRTILDILRFPHHERSISRRARNAAAKVTQDPSIVMPGNLDQLTNFASPLLFLRPVRTSLPKNLLEADLSAFVLEIPTPHLAEIFHEARQEATIKISENQASELFAALTSHSLTRCGADWDFEVMMHIRFTSDREPLHLRPSGSITPAKRLLSNNVAALASVELYDSFYWLPSVEDFEGIDALIGDRYNIYALQASISEKIQNPEAGLREIWEAVHPSVRTRRWHFVVITNTDARSERYLE